MILDANKKKKRRLLPLIKEKNPPELVRRRALAGGRRPLDFAAALRVPGRLGIIAEVKKASPSKGLIRDPFKPLEIAQAYQSADVQALSVLTETEFFQGAPEYLAQIRAHCPLPLLRKDFIIDPYQIYEAYLLGADAVLLIAAVLEDGQLVEFSEIARSLGMQCLLEVHDQAELERALGAGGTLLGVNNRNLKDFSEDLQTTARLAKQLPDTVTLVSESGVKNSRDLTFLKSCGADAALIGESFMCKADIAAAVREMRGGS